MSELLLPHNPNQGFDDESGLDTERYARPDCPVCAGSGYYPMDDGGALPRHLLCACVPEGRRRHACETRIRVLFGEGGSKMTFKRYGLPPGHANTAALEGARAYVKNWPSFREAGVGFCLMGPAGAGKTHIATATLIALIKKYPGRDGKVLNAFHLSVPEMMRMSRKRMDDKSTADVVELAMMAEICLLDDIGAERKVRTDDNMSWAEEALFDILNYRISHSLPTLFTTNLDYATLTGDEGRTRGALDPRIVDRVKRQTAVFYQTQRVEGKAEPSSALRELLTGSSAPSLPAASSGGGQKAPQVPIRPSKKPSKPGDDPLLGMLKP